MVKKHSRDLWYLYRKNLNNWAVCYVAELFPSQYSQEEMFLLSRKGKVLCFAVLLSFFPEKRISDYIEHRPVIQVFTVLGRKM